MKADGTWSTPPNDNTTYNAFTGATDRANGISGLVPAPAQGDQTNKYLKADGSWDIPAGSSSSPFIGATTSAGGEAGIVPAPAIAESGTVDDNRFLCADGTWKMVTLATGAISNSDAVRYLFHQLDTEYNTAGELIYSNAIPSNFLLEVVTTGTSSASSENANTALQQRGSTELTSVAYALTEAEGIEYLFHQTAQQYYLGETVNSVDLPRYLNLEATTAGQTSYDDITIE